MDDKTMYDQINEAIEKYIGSSLSPEVRMQIKNHFGEEIARKAEAVYEAAMDCPVDWRTETMDSALAILAEYLKSNYSWLTENARRTLNYCFIMAWK